MGVIRNFQPDVRSQDPELRNLYVSLKKSIVLHIASMQALHRSKNKRRRYIKVLAHLLKKLKGNAAAF